MNTQQIATRLSELCSKGQFETAHETSATSGSMMLLGAASGL